MENLATAYKEAKPLSNDQSEEDLGITWQKYIPDNEVLTQASLSSIYTISIHSQLHWVGHVVRMKDHRLPRKLLNGKLFQQALPRRPEKALQRNTEGFHEIFRHRP